MKNSKTIIILTAAFLLGTSSLYTLPMSAMAQDNHQEENHDHEEDNHKEKENHNEGDHQEDHSESEGDHEEEGVVEMDAAERQKNGVLTAHLSMQTLGDEITAPGEVVMNQYKTVHVTSRISGQITKRHAKLGQLVKRGAPMVTLTSVRLAEAQGNAIVAAQEWQRVQALGQDVVSKRRYVEAQIAAQLSEARIKAYGMTPKFVSKLLAGGDASKATGIFTLYASQSGTVMKDAFVLGEIIEPGRELFVISDESKAWVNVKLSQGDAKYVEIGTPIQFKTGDGNRPSDWQKGKIVQLGHRIDEATRTLSVRAQMDNAGDNLHAGQFVTAYIQTGSTHKVLVAPIDAVTFMEGQDVVFVVEGNELHPTPVQLGQKRGGWVEIKGGINSDTQIATSQIFLLKSLILKSKMGSGHAH